MIPWATLAEAGQRLAVVTGLAVPVWSGLNYLQLAPVTQSYVTEQLGTVRKDINASRVDTLDTKRVVLGLARGELFREQQALEVALKNEGDPLSKSVWQRRLENIRNEIESIDRKVARLDDRMEGMKTNE